MAKYVEAELDIIQFDAEDVITTSCTVDITCTENDNGCPAD